MNKSPILIVEDNPIEANDIATAITCVGYSNYHLCSSGEDALLFCENTAPLLVLMDIGLSGKIDGIEAAEILIHERNIPVIYLTGSSDNDTIIRTKNTHPYGFLLKPVSNRFMHITIEMALSRYELESQLKRNKNFMTLTLNSIVEGVIAVEQGGKIIFINEQALKLIGLSHEEALAQPVNHVYKTIDPITGTIMDCTPLSVIETGESVIYRETHDLLNSSDNHIPISENCSPLINSSNQLFGAVLVFQDISLKKQSEQEKLKTRKMESMSKLASGLAHDFNNILTGVIGNVSILKMLLETTDPQIIEIIQEIEKSSNRARDLANQIRLFAKGESPAKKAADLKSLITDTGSFVLAGSMAGLDIQYNTEIDSLTFDPQQMCQVFENLLMNSKEAITGPGSISIIITEQRIGSSSPLDVQSGSYVRITIRDTGSGISPEIAEHVFEPFFTTKKSSSGMGLATTYNIVKSHGGTIILDSMANPTSFSIYLPVDRNLKENSSRESTMPKNSHILIVDDEKSILIMLDKMLTTLGFIPHVFSRPQKALEFIKTCKNEDTIINACILDLSIPGTEGGALSLIDVIKESFPEALYILISGHQCENPVIAEYKKYGFDELIHKPFSLYDLQSLLLK
ncbi:MAG: response regulator [Spirochaetes bacterium]|jgi:two-component system cell cycle sensor histidine kinase/response regulator CckA|nr:response regulator [Spirochaetota bacterium]